MGHPPPAAVAFARVGRTFLSDAFDFALKGHVFGRADEASYLGMASAMPPDPFTIVIPSEVESAAKRRVQRSRGTRFFCVRDENHTKEQRCPVSHLTKRTCVIDSS